MDEISRREYLKRSAVVMTGMAVAGCTSEHSGAVFDRDGGDEDSIFEAGAVPIEQSGWTAGRGVFPGYPALTGDQEADVVIVGAGLAGSSLALHLTEARLKVAVLERHQPGWGASGRNAGHVLPVLKDLDLIRGFPDGGRRFLEIFQEHHTIPFDLSRKYGFFCDAEQTGYLNAMSREKAFQQQRDESLFWIDQGQEVAWLGGSDMQRLTGTTRYPHGVLYRSGGRVNPYLLTNGMIRAAAQRGASIHGESEALVLARQGRRWRVGTEAGSVVADRVVFCTNAYPGAIVPEFSDNYYPLLSYALCTQPLPARAAEIIMPSRAAMAQVPIDLNPLVIDGDNRLITASIPGSNPADAAWHFRHHLAWIHRTWPETRELGIEMEHYWTGRVAMREREFPGVFRLRPGVYGLMHFNAWGNVMAPLLGKVMAEALAADRIDQLPFPVEEPEPVANMNRQELMIRKVMIPLARTAQRIGII